jgi:hypothetical protein
MLLAFSCCSSLVKGIYGLAIQSPQIMYITIERLIFKAYGIFYCETMCQDNKGEIFHHDPYYNYYLRMYAGPSPTFAQQKKPEPKPSDKEKVQFD